MPVAMMVKKNSIGPYVLLLVLTSHRVIQLPAVLARTPSYNNACIFSREKQFSL